MAYEDIASLYQGFSPQSQFAGVEGSRLADPFMNERTAYQNQLRTLMENPGAFASSPVYKFAFDQGLDALTKRSAASGRIGSTNYLNQLQQYGQQMASQQFFPQANLLAMLSGATTGSPAAAGLSYVGGVNRSQDQRAMAGAARNMSSPANTLPRGDMGFGGGGGYGGGKALPTGGHVQDYGSYAYPGGEYMPATGAGMGYLMNNQTGAATGFADGGWGSIGTGYIPSSYGNTLPMEQTSYDWQDSYDWQEPYYDGNNYDASGYDYYTEE